VSSHSDGALQRTLPIIRTLRLVLSAMKLGDAAEVFAYAVDPEVLRFTTGTTPTRLEATHAWLAQALADPETRMWALRLHDDATVIGAIEFGVPEPGVGSVHYALARAHWGKGLMTEAVDAMCRWAVETMPELRAIATSVVAANPGSARVLEKCGFRRVGTATEQWDKEPEPVELHIYRRELVAEHGASREPIR
jgi:[ribosomal protein S5]-alanine N-acetyltransferase